MPDLQYYKEWLRTVEVIIKNLDYKIKYTRDQRRRYTKKRHYLMTQIHKKGGNTC